MLLYVFSNSLFLQSFYLLIFEFYPGFREGNFCGMAVSKNALEGYTKYELKLPTDKMFSRVYGDLILHYTVYDMKESVEC